MSRIVTTLILVCSLLPFSILPAQSTFYAGFESGTYPRGFNRIVPTPDQGFAVIAGSIEKSILKFDANWSIEWAYHLDDIFTLQDLILTNDNHLVAMGHGDNGYTAIYVTKFDLSGNIVYQEDLEYDFGSSSFSLTAFSLLTAYDDGFLILGGNCVGENLVIRCDKDGDVVWSKEYVNTSEAGTGAIWEGVKTGNGEYVMVSTNRDLSFFKINDSGNMLWHTHYSFGASSPAITEIVGLPSGGFLVSGYYYDSNNVQQQCLARSSNQGTISWLKQLASPSSSTTMSGISEMVIAPNNEVMIFGTIAKSGSQNTQFQVSRFDFNGNHIGTNLSGSDFFQYGFDEIRDICYQNGDLYMVGHSAYDNDVVAKLDPNGNGFCNSAAFTPAITDITPTTVWQPDNAAVYNLPVKRTARTYVHSVPTYVRTVFCGNMPTSSEAAVEAAWTVWPQPAAGDFWLQHPVVNSGQVKVIDMTGKEVAKQEISVGSSQTRIWAGAIPAGVYILQADADGQRHSQKLIMN